MLCQNVPKTRRLQRRRGRVKSLGKLSAFSFQLSAKGDETALAAARWPGFQPKAGD